MAITNLVYMITEDDTLTEMIAEDVINNITRLTYYDGLLATVTQVAICINRFDALGRAQIIYLKFDDEVNSAVHNALIRRSGIDEQDCPVMSNVSIEVVREYDQVSTVSYGDGKKLNKVQHIIEVKVMDVITDETGGGICHIVS